MPWSNQGGGGGGPWGGGPAAAAATARGVVQAGSGGGGGPQPPDLEDLLRRGQDRFRRVMPGGFGSGNGHRHRVVALVVLIWLVSGFYRVQPDEQGVVLRFGALGPDRPARPATITSPAPIETVLTPKVTRVNRIEIGFRRTGDGRRAGTAAGRDRGRA